MEIFERSFDRRTALKLAGSGLIFLVGGKVLFGTEVTAEQRRDFGRSPAGTLVRDLPPLDGVFTFDPAVCQAIATDFGKFVSQVPWGVLKPGSVADIQKIVQFANRHQIHVVMRGTGGATYGQTQVLNGIVIDSSTMKAVKPLSGRPGVYRLQPGAIWGDVLDETIKSGYVPPVLPDTMVISVGGTLNAAGIGETSYRLGPQLNFVTRLRVITGAGEDVWCSPTENRGLFQFILGGMGQCGLIVEAQVQMIRDPGQVITEEFRYPGLEHDKYLADLAMVARSEPKGAIGAHIARQPDGSWTCILQVTYWSSQSPAWKSRMQVAPVGAPVTQTFHQYAHRNSAGWSTAVANGSAAFPHPYLSCFMPSSTMGELIEHSLKTPDDNLGVGRFALFPMLTAAFRPSLQAMPTTPISYHFRFYRVVNTKTDPNPRQTHLSILRSNQESLLPRVLGLGGKVFLPFSPLLNFSQRRLQFGDAVLRSFTLAKRRFDPRMILTPNAGLFG